MLAARRAMLGEALQEIDVPVTVWVQGDEGAREAADLVTLQGLQPLLAVRPANLVPHPWLPVERYPVYRVGTPESPQTARAGFVGFPEGFMLDAFCDLAVAVSRGDAPASPLARDTLRQMRDPVEITILTTPG